MCLSGLGNLAALSSSLCLIGKVGAPNCILDYNILASYRKGGLYAIKNFEFVGSI